MPRGPIRPVAAALLGVLVVLPLSAAGGEGPAPGAPALGFSPEGAAREARAEEALRAGTSAASCRETLRALTARPRVAGTPGGDAARALVAARLRALGYRVEEAAYDVLLSYPGRIRVSARGAGDAGPAVLLDSDAPSGPEETGETPFPFNAYSASGEVRGPLVYVGFGGEEDAAALEKSGVDLRGKVVLARYGRSFRGLKVRVAESRGAAAVLLYSDPGDDGAGKGPVHPAGPWRPEDGVQRGSLQYISIYPGDPLTPGRPSLAGVARLPRGEVAVLPRIPCVPLSPGQARRLLAVVGGAPAEPPAGGALLPPEPRALSAPGAVVEVSVRMREETRTIRDVVATLPGAVRPDRRVILGSHRDSWGPGAVDAGSGTTALLEAAAGIAAAARAGFPPARTVQFCSWDGEEYGLHGSVEWCEEHAETLGREAVAYLNCDPGVSGPDLGLSGAPALFPLLREVASGFPSEADPARNLWEVLVETAAKDPLNAGRACPCGLLGSGSDYTAFLDRLGIPAADLQFSGSYGVYHSVHDGFPWMERNGDPRFERHLRLARMMGTAALRLANAEVPPLSYATAGDEARRHLAQFRKDRPGADLAAPERAAGLLAGAGGRWEMLLAKRLAGGAPLPGAAEAADDLRDAERAFLHPAGIRGREWFRHLVYAPGLATGYAADPLPALAEALRTPDAAAAAREAARLAGVLDAARACVERAIARLEGGEGR